MVSFGLWGLLDLRTLTVRPSDVTGAPLGSSSGVADVVVTAEYDRLVETDNGTRIEPGIRTPLTRNPSNGYWSIPLLPGDDPRIVTGAGVCVTIRVEAAPRQGRGRGGHSSGGTVLGSKTIQMHVADPASVSIADKESVVPIPPAQQVIDWAALEAGSAAAVAKGDEAISIANGADDKADNAVTLAAAANAGTDSGVAALISTTGPSTQAALKAAIRGTMLGPEASGSNDTSALQSFVNANAGKAVTLPANQSYTVNGTITVPAGGIRINMQGSTITQTAATYVPVFDATGRESVVASGGKFIGPNNYAESTAVYTGCVIRAGAGSKSVRLIDCDVLGFAGPAIYATDSKRVTVRGCTIIGPGNGGGAGTFAFNAGVSKDSAAVIVDGTTTSVWIIDNDLSYVAQGILGGNTTDGFHIRGNDIHDVGGQHGIYLNAGSNFEISGNTVRRTAAQGIKVQTNSGSGAPDLLGSVIANNIIHDTTGNGIHVVSAVPPAVDKRVKDVAITGNSIRNATGDGIQVTYSAMVSIVGNILDTIGGAGVHIADSTDITVALNRTKDSQKQGLFIEAPNKPTTGIRTLGNTFRNFGLGGGTTADFGIHVNGANCSDLTFDGDQIYGTGLVGRYLIYIATGDQATMSFRNLVGSGATASGFRGVSATKVREWTNNTLDGATNRFFQVPADYSMGYPGRFTYGATAPTAGTWVPGDICRAWPPTSGGAVGWICTTGGTPGTWKQMGTIA